MSPAEPIPVLVSSAGTASAVNVIKSLRLQGEARVRIVACDADPSAAGLRLADEYAVVPPASDVEYGPALSDLCERTGVRAFLPIHSTEVGVAAGRAGEWSRLGVATLLSSETVIDLCNDKRAAADRVRALGIETPAVFEECPDASLFPVFVKRLRGSGSVGARRVDTPEELRFTFERDGDALTQEFVHGVEHTVDVLCDETSELVAACARERTSVKAGQSVKGVTVDAPELVKAARRIVKELNVVGPCNLQFIVRSGTPVFIELNPRFAAGGLMLTVHAGMNLPFMALKRMLGMPIKDEERCARAGVRMSRYWEEIIYED